MKPRCVFILWSCSSTRLISSPRLARSVATDQGVRRAVVLQLRLRLALELRDDPLRELLAELHAPLVEGIDVPNGPLREHAVLVERDQRAERLRRQPVSEDRRRRTVPLARSVRHEPLGRLL